MLKFIRQVWVWKIWLLSRNKCERRSCVLRAELQQLWFWGAWFSFLSQAGSFSPVCRLVFSSFASSLAIKSFPEVASSRFPPSATSLYAREEQLSRISGYLNDNTLSSKSFSMKRKTNLFFGPLARAFFRFSFRNKNIIHLWPPWKERALSVINTLKWIASMLF